MGIGTRRLAAVLAAFALLPAAADAAADRFAGPSGTSADPCTQAQPCDLVTAINDAINGDDITIEPGTYGSPTPINTNLTDSGTYQLTIHGEAGRPRPVIDTTAAYGFNLTDGSSTLSDVQVDDTADNSFGVYVDGSIDHVYVEDSGSSGTACTPDGTVIDSVCWASGDGGVGVGEGNADAVGTLRNDTVIASGASGDAVYLDAAGTGSLQIEMTDTIAKGAANDVYAATGSPGSEATIDADHSNYATVLNGGGGGTVTVTPVGSGTNQTTPPEFVDAITGNFHELAGSATVGAGIDSSLNGTTDLDGNPREINGTTDIGAYELVPPPSCSAVSVTAKFGTATGATLHCTDALGAAVTYAIAHGPAHGKVTLDAATGAATYTPAAGFSGSDSFSYDATSSHGTSADATVSVTVGKEPAPSLSSVKLSKSTFTFKLNEAATVTLTFSALGRTKGTVKLKGKAGKNTYRFKGKVSGGHKPKAGKYTVTVRASNGAGRSTSHKLKLTIKG